MVFYLEKEKILPNLQLNEKAVNFFLSLNRILVFHVVFLKTNNINNTIISMVLIGLIKKEMKFKNKILLFFNR